MSRCYQVHIQLWHCTPSAVGNPVTLLALMLVLILLRIDGDLEANLGFKCHGVSGLILGVLSRQQRSQFVHAEDVVL